MIGDKWIKISKESIDFLRDNNKGNLKNVPQELKNLFYADTDKLSNIWKKQQGIGIDLEEEYDPDKDGIPFEEIFNYDGNIEDIKEGTILYDEELDADLTVGNITKGKNLTFLNIVEMNTSIMISMVYDERFRTLEIKNN